MNSFEEASQFTDDRKKVSQKVRIREIGSMGATSNFWESSNGWKGNQAFVNFLFSIDSNHKLKFEECSKYSPNGNCTEWLDVSDSPNIAEFKRQISERVLEIEASGRKTKELKLIEIINRETFDLYSYIMSDSWKPADAARLFLEFKREKGGKVGIVFSSRDKENNEFEEISSNDPELGPIKEALNNRLRELREAREADSNDRNNPGKPRLN